VEPIQLAAVLAAIVLVASMASVELGVTVALIELTLGVIAGNVFDLESIVCYLALDSAAASSKT